MAISVLSITYGSAAVHANSQTINIPATTAGSTLIFVCSFRNFAGAFGNNAVYFVVNNDWNGVDPSQYTLIADTGMSSSQRSQIGYRSNVPAGLTSIQVSCLDATNGFYVSVFEAAGVNVITPLDQQGTHVATVTNTNAVGPSLTTAKTNALFVSTGISTQATQGSPNNGGGNSPWIKTSSPAGNTASDRVQAYMLAGPGTFNSTMNRTVNNTQTYAISSASFNSDPNSFTLNLSETIVMDDTLEDEADYQRLLSESFSLADVVNLINFSNNQFKSLSDTMTITDFLITVFSGARIFSDSISLEDTISFHQDFAAVLTENIRLTEWMSIKITNSTRWGD